MYLSLDNFVQEAESLQTNMKVYICKLSYSHMYKWGHYPPIWPVYALPPLNIFCFNAIDLISEYASYTDIANSFQNMIF